MKELDKDLLRTAWYGVSFDPEKRADRFESEYKETLEIFYENVKNADITEEQKAECLEYWENRLYNQAMKYISMQSRCMSAMVVGPAKFPVKSQEKKHNSAMKAIDDYLYTVNKMTTMKIFERYMTKEQKQSKVDENAFRLIAWDIAEFIKFKIHGLTLDSNNWTFNAFPHLKGKFTTQAKNGNFGTCEKVLEVLKEHLAKGVKIQKNIDILQGILDEYKNKESEVKESKEYEIDGVEVVENTADDRLQLFFDGKPEQEMINKLKANGFRWSPKNKAWQRQLTDNARIALKRVLGE